MAVIIGVDPHKGSHTAVAIDDAEKTLAELRVPSCADQAERLVLWAARWPERTWAVEGAAGLGRLLAQQLQGAGETVLDVQPKLGARVRLLTAGNVNKNDPNDARSVAVAALRSKGLRPVVAEDDTTVLKLWSKRRRDLGRARTQVACRLHALLCELVPGGAGKREITAAQAASTLDNLKPSSLIELARVELGRDFLEDLRRLDLQMRDTKKRMEAAVAASGTTVTAIFGVGPFVAATVIGYVADVSRFANKDHFAAYNGTAPIEVSSGAHKVHRLSRRGNRQLNHAIHMAAVTQARFRHSEGRAYYERKIAEGKTSKEALRALKRRISDAIFARLVADARRRAQHEERGPGGQAGDGSLASVAGLHPERRLFGKATPEPTPTILPRPASRPSKAPNAGRKKIPKAS